MSNSILPEPKTLEEAQGQIISLQKQLNDLDLEHTKLSAIIMTISKVLGLYPLDKNYIVKVLIETLITIKKNNYSNVVEKDLNDVIRRLGDTVALLNSVLENKPIIDVPDDVSESYLKMNSNDKNKIHLKIACRYVDGSLQIGYMRDTSGKEHNFSDKDNNISFYINVELDEYLLHQKIPEVKGQL